MYDLRNAPVTWHSRIISLVGLAVVCIAIAKALLED